MRTRCTQNKQRLCNQLLLASMVSNCTRNIKLIKRSCIVLYVLYVFEIFVSLLCCHMFELDGDRHVAEMYGECKQSAVAFADNGYPVDDERCAEAVGEHGQVRRAGALLDKQGQDVRLDGHVCQESQERCT